MASSKELLAPKEITRAELAALVQEWIDAGNEITQIAPGVALNFRTPETPNVPIPKKIKQLRRLKEAKIAATTGKAPKRNKRRK